eukprot:RCo034850
MSSLIKTSLVRGIQVLALNRPPVNALSKALVTELVSAYEEAEEADGVKGILVRSMHPSTFCAGLDLNEVSGMTNHDELFTMVTALNRMARTPLRLSKPVACVVEGHTIAAGAYLALACDYLVLQKPGQKAANGKPYADYQVGLTEIPVGVPFPDHALAVIRHRIYNPRHLRDFIFVGETMSPEQAFSKGFGDALEAKAEEAAWRWLERMTSYAPGVFTHTKRQMNGPFFRGIQEPDGQLTRLLAPEERDLPVVTALAHFQAPTQMSGEELLNSAAAKAGKPRGKAHAP